MNSSPLSQKIPAWRQLVSLPALPVIGLYLVAYRLIGKRCTYRLGHFDVTPSEPISSNQDVAVRLLTALIIFAALAILVIVSHLAGRPVNPLSPG